LLQGARRTTARLAILVEYWLSAGNIRSGRVSLHRRPTRLSAVIDDALALVHPLIEARAQCVERDIPRGDLHVLADRRYLRQVLSNLLDNAAKYSPKGEVIRIRARKSGGRVQITIEDHGPGIPADKRVAVFECFYRLASDHGVPGTGLGLAIVKAIVEAHGGTIAVKERTGIGTAICFSLPAAEGSRQR
jgi:signal transduction histidine kinase